MPGDGNLGAGMNHWYHQDMGYRSIVNMLMMCGTVGVSGGGFAHYVGQERLGDLQGHCAPLTLLREPERFASIAAEVSNCPSGQQGGNLGQIGYGDTFPEFEKVLFRSGPTGLLPELVRTRYGFHVASVDQRILGEKLPFDVVRDDIAERVTAMVEQKAVRQYITVLAGQAEIHGVDLGGSESPLVQ